MRSIAVVMLAVLVSTACLRKEQAPQSSDSPSNLSAFAFILGQWEAEVRLPQPDGTVATQNATWSARYVLGGRAILEEYEAVDAKGEVAVIGVNLRSYDAENNLWTMYWFDLLSGEVIHLGPPELGGVTIEEDSVSFRFQYGEVLSRARFEDIAANSFTWHGDVSTDGGERWQTDTITVEARRVGQ